MTTKTDSARPNKKHTGKLRTNTTHSDDYNANKRGVEGANKGQKNLSKKPSSRSYNTKKKPLEPIRKIEWPEHLCDKCGKPITDLTQALSDKSTGQPVHFECILSLLKNTEELKEKEEIVYIGHGNFAIVYFENPRIRSKFKIVKLIEWEDRSKTVEWQVEIAKLGSST